MYDVIVVGCGFSGTVIANLFANSGKKVCIIEKRKHIAGNMYDYHDRDNFLMHKYGPHVLMLNDEKVYNYLSEFTSWLELSVELETYIDGKFIPLPINFNSICCLYEKNKADLIINKLLSEYGAGNTINVLDLLVSTDAVIREFGNEIYEKVFVGYNKKMWGLSPTEINKNVIGRSPIKLSYENKKSTSRYEVVPNKGYTNLFEKMLNNQNIDIILNKSANDILKIINNEIYFEEQIFKGKVVYTAPLDELFNFEFGHLPYRAIYFRRILKKVKNEYCSAAVTFPMNYKKTRTTEMKKITLEKHDDTVLLSEYPGNYDIKSKNFNNASYPILNDDSTKMIRKYYKRIEKINNFYIIGRLAEFKYLNMEETIISAFELFKAIGKEEPNI